MCSISTVRTAISHVLLFVVMLGVLLHYDEVNLQDVYFLDPQWLCDMLASIITIREINSLAKSGELRLVRWCKMLMSQSPLY